MSARRVAIGRALEDLKPAVLELARMSHLVSGHAESCFGLCQGGMNLMPEADADALLFGVYELDSRVRKIQDAFKRALNETLDA